jgi:hypothetical protein
MEVLGILLLVTFSGISIIALLATLNLLLPTAIEKTLQNLELALRRSLLLGVINFIFGLALVGLFGWLAELTEQASSLLSGVFILLLGLIVFGVAIFALLGLAAFAKLLGERIGGVKSPFTSNLRGGLLLLLAGMTPYVGWFLFTPLVLWTGLGAAISAQIRTREKADPVEEAM